MPELISTVIAIILAAIYTGIGLVGFWVFGGRMTNAADLYFVLAPLLALPAAIICLFSRKSGAIIMGVYFLLDWLVKIIISLPAVALNPLDSYSAWFLSGSVMFSFIALYFARKNRQVSDVDRLSKIA